MGTDATCVFFVAHGLSKVDIGLLMLLVCIASVVCCQCYSSTSNVACVWASIDYVGCRRYLSTSNIILCATSAINLTLALPMVFKEFKFYWWCSHAFNDA
jgi:hypothetical protein